MRNKKTKRIKRIILMPELRNVIRALQEKQIPSEADIEYIVNHQNLLSDKEKEEFDKILPQLNKVMSRKETKEKALISKRENPLMKIPFVKKVYEKLQDLRKYKEIYKEMYNETENEANNEKTAQKEKTNIRKDVKNSEPYKRETIVISDLHGRADKWEFVRQQLMINPNLKVIILGDVMDRQPYGLEMLLEIKELSDCGRVQYLPGNHDMFAYNYVKAKNRNQGIYEEAKCNLEYNGGKTTMEKLDSFDKVVLEEMKYGRVHKQITLDEFMDWLGRQPIQATTTENNTNYALAHALFDTALYNFKRGFCLQDALNMELQGNNNEILNRFQNVMWYRENDERTHYAPLSWPQDFLVVVGHTPQQNVNNQIIGQDPRKSIIYVDCGKGALQGFNLTTGQHKIIEPEITNRTTAQQSEVR